MSRKAVKDKRLIRLLRLLKILQSGSGKNVLVLAKLCKVGPRTIFRDLRALRDVGVPIEFDSKAERYYLAGEPGIPASDFTPDEAVKIVALANEFGRRRQLPFYDAAYDAARKIEPRFSASVQQTVRKLASAIRIRPSQLTHFNEKHAAFNVLLASIQQRRVIQIQYASLT